MAQEGFCPIHGPYDASLGACPYPHEGINRPIPPTPLDEDDLPTDLGGYDEPTAPTAPPGSEKEGETEIPARRKAGHGILDIDDEEETELGRGMRDDVTELEVTPGGGPLAMLWVKEGPRRGKFYPIRHGTVMGRKEGNLILDDPKVSGSHAKFTMEKDDFFIWDFGSANGTYVNGKKIREATLLEENDLVKIGDTFFVVKLLESRPKRKASRKSEDKNIARSKSHAKSSRKARS